MKISVFKIISMIIFIWVEVLSAVAQTPELKINGGHSASINSVCYSSDDKYIASGSFDKTIKLWDTKTGKELKTFSNSNNIKSVVFSPNEKYIISAGDILGGDVRIWEISSGKYYVLSNQGSNYIDITKDGRYIRVYI